MKEKDKILSESNPILVEVIDVHFHAKSNTTCDLRFIKENKVYEDVKISRKVIVGRNNKDFYYDVKNKIVFFNNNDKNVLLILLIFFIISIFLWFIPRDKFKF